MKEFLIINQNSSANSLIKSRLENDGYSVETVEDGKNGILKAIRQILSSLLPPVFAFFDFFLI